MAPPKTAAKLAIALEAFERMTERDRRDGRHGRPHELMRCAEVTFIRDCAELAARASLVRTESRWGLYHDRPTSPAATTPTGSATSTCAAARTAARNWSSARSPRTWCR